ncbi:hypothetical protein M5E86_22765 [Blautia wexlerae]|nr:hypothetical protein M5E86_22765 [Blautia wexlerae]
MHENCLAVSESPQGKYYCSVRFLLSLDLSDTQRLLDIGQKPRLYPRVRYDAKQLFMDWKRR